MRRGALLSASLSSKKIASSENNSMVDVESLTPRLPLLKRNV